MTHHVTTGLVSSDTKPSIVRLRLPATDGYTLTAYRFDPTVPAEAGDRDCFCDGGVPVV